MHRLKKKKHGKDGRDGGHKNSGSKKKCEKKIDLVIFEVKKVGKEKKAHTGSWTSDLRDGSAEIYPWPKQKWFLEYSDEWNEHIIKYCTRTDPGGHAAHASFFLFRIDAFVVKIELFQF